MISSTLLGPGDAGGGFNSGLGNILFQIATILSLAKDNNTSATFPQLKDIKYSNFYENILYKINTEYHHFKYQITVPFGFHKLDFKDDTIYQGYFQTEKFFVHNREYILDKLINEKIIDQILNKNEYLKHENTLSVHVRRGDYLTLKNIYYILDKNYYNNAIDKCEYDKILIFSDHIEWCKKNFNNKNIIFIENQPEYIDLIMMSLCKNNIISNSTFGWWGAWLNTNKNKKIISPKNWLKTEDDTDIVPKDWFVINNI